MLRAKVGRLQSVVARLACQQQVKSWPIHRSMMALKAASGVWAE